MDSMQEEAVIRRHPITAGIIGLITVVYSAIIFILFLLARDAVGYEVIFGTMALAPYLLLFGAVGGALFFRSRSLAHQFWLAPALFAVYGLLYAAATSHSFA
ncbi:hypothetical protein [Pseudoduganella sp. R-34]|uniref:hypothetical protein n=1 Tax=unclassified Pseudoduganella TaxID=2637179 RepID=UPI003CEB75CD